MDMNDIKFIIADYSSHFDNYETFINVLKCKLQCLHSNWCTMVPMTLPKAKVLCDVYMIVISILIFFSDSNIFHINIY